MWVRDLVRRLGWLILFGGPTLMVIFIFAGAATGALPAASVAATAVGVIVESLAFGGALILLADIHEKLDREP